MNYTEITTTALKFADREHDTAIQDLLPMMLSIVESRINRRIKTLQMATRASLVMTTDTTYYGLPSDFSGVRDVQVNTPDGVCTLQYLNPQQMNAVTDDTPDAYTLIANQIQLHPARDDSTLEIIYYATLNPLSVTEPANWLSAKAADVYIFGLLVEISAFIKDASTGAVWDQRFNDELNILATDDQKVRWSGTPLQIKAR